MTLKPVHPRAPPRFAVGRTRAVRASVPRRRYGRSALAITLIALVAQALPSNFARSVSAQSPAAPQVQVTVAGVGGEIRDNVLSQLAIEQRRRDTDQTDARVHRLHRQAEGEIRRALEPFGHYRPRIDAELTRVPAGWHASYRIDPGPAVRVVELDVRALGPGAEDPAFRERIAAFPLRSGEVLRHDLYEFGKLELLGVASERGYLQARLTTHRVAVDTVSLESRITLHLETGERHRFGEVRFDQSALEDDVLRAMVPFRPGDPYDTSELVALQRAIMASDFFRSVDVRPRPEEADALRVPIDILLEPRPRHLVGLGAGYGTDTGPRASASLEIRRLNRWGHRLTSGVRGSPVRSGVNARYLIPRGSAGDQFAFSLGFQDDRPRVHVSQSLQVGASLNHRRGRWREQIYVNLQQEWFELGETSGTTRLVLPGASWSQTRSDDPIHTSRGSRLQLDVRGTDEALGSEVGFLQATLRGKRIRSPWRDGRLLLRGDLGYTAVDEFDRLPPTLRFFAGGDGSIRGFGYQSITPRDEEGEPLGGRHLLVGSVEYEHRVLGDWGIAVFYDVGSAYNTFGGNLKRGAGAGIRWVSPVGLVRMDVAAALSEPGQPMRLHIVIGPDL